MITQEQLNLTSNLRYTAEHVWIKKDADTYLVGISDYAQDQLGEVAFVDLPQVDTHFEANAEFGTVESVKSVNALFMPVAGTVLEVNGALEDTPTLINASCYDAGWLLRIQVDTSNEVDSLLDAAGGGAVYHDLGNLNFSFITHARDRQSNSFERFLQPVALALADLGVPATLTGRNDLEAYGKKISGSSQIVWKDKILHHGTLLINVKLSDAANKLVKNKYSHQWGFFCWIILGIIFGQDGYDLPLRAWLGAMTTVQEACAEDILTALRPIYGNFKAFTQQSVNDTLLTAEVNGLLEESRFELDDKDNLRLYFRAHPEGAKAINRYIH